MEAAKIAGLEVPSTAPLFLAVLALHLPAGLTAVLSGALAALSQKGSRRHRAAGQLYLRALWLVFATAVTLAVLRWPHDLHLLALGTAALIAGLLGRRARRRHPLTDGGHILGMASSYVLLLTAFYVDNGPHLPLWDRLPDLAFWFVPGLVATPITVRALRRHRGVAVHRQA
jgi:Na+-driven multidrug efflux pump